MDKPWASLIFKQFVTKTVTVGDEYLPQNTTALSFLAAHPEVDSQRIFLLGLSLGGTVAPRICAASPVPLAGMISMAATCRPLVDVFLDQSVYLQDHFPKPTKTYELEIDAIKQTQMLLRQDKGLSHGRNPPKHLPYSLPMSYFIDDFIHNPVQIARDLDLPMLFLHGARDWQVLPADLEKFRSGLEGSQGANRAICRMYDDVGHLFVPFTNEEEGPFQYDEPGHVSPVVIKDIIQWIGSEEEK
jgi:uncharacterized protein